MRQAVFLLFFLMTVNAFMNMKIQIRARLSVSRQCVIFPRGIPSYPATPPTIPILGLRIPLYCSYHSVIVFCMEAASPLHIAREAKRSGRIRAALRVRDFSVLIRVLVPIDCVALRKSLHLFLSFVRWGE